MIDTRRIDHVTVATPDAEAARETFRRSFGFAPAAARPGALQIGDAQIQFVTPAAGSALAMVLATSGEGMAELCLEVASLDAAVNALSSAGVAYTMDESAGTRMLRVDPQAAHRVRLSLVERR